MGKGATAHMRWKVRGYMRGKAVAPAVARCRMSRRETQRGRHPPLRGKHPMPHAAGKRWQLRGKARKSVGVAVVDVGSVYFVISTPVILYGG